MNELALVAASAFSETKLIGKGGDAATELAGADPSI